MISISLAFSKIVDEEPVDFLIQLQDTKSTLVGTLKVASGEWQKYELHYPEVSCDSAALLVLAQSKGKVALDMVSLFPEKTFYGEAKWYESRSGTGACRVTARFMRFPVVVLFTVTE